MNIIDKDIQSNRGLSGKRMTEAQLMTLLRFVAKYDFKLPDMSDWTVKKASKAIDITLKHINRGTVKKRKKHYNIDNVLNRFIRKYPSLYDSIVNRNR